MASNGLALLREAMYVVEMPTTGSGEDGGRVPRGHRLSHDDIAAAARTWAADHEDGAVEDALAALGLDDADKDAAVIVRAVLARAAWNREGAHARQQTGYGQ
jgi:hypothetical protein